MTFLQPWLLVGLPLMVLPIVIHLIHQHRHRTVPWAAMMFLVSAQRMSRGIARLRYVLIMLMRMAAVGALIFALSRPLVSGWLGGVGMARPDTTLILLDRSASMEAQDIQTGQSKRSTALAKLAELLDTHDLGTQLVLIDSASGAAQPLESPQDLLGLPGAGASSTSADIPGMLEQALAYLRASQSGRADIWICSDLSENDWDAASGRWPVLREQFAQLKGVHVFLLSYADRPIDNLSIRVTNVKRRKNGSRAELVLDVLVSVEGRLAPINASAQRVPVEFEVNGVRSVIEVEVDVQGASLQGHRIPIDSDLRAGWGSVALPADSNPLDNRFYFVFSEPPVREAVVVADDRRMGQAFRRVLAIPTEPGLQHSADILIPEQVDQVDFEGTGLLIWQAPLPSGLVAKQIERFVDAGRVVMFFPPGQSNGGQLFATRWGRWGQPKQEQSKVTWWRSDADLLAHVGSGDALPLNELRIYRTCTADDGLDAGKPGTPLARLGEDQSLLLRVATDRGGVYFCMTLPTAQFSSLERDGVVFYVMLQRALAEGCRSLTSASQRDAAPRVLADRSQWELVASTGNVPGISQRELHAGVYRDGDYWAALNRSPAEDRFQATPAATVDDLFAGLSYERIDDAVDDNSSLASEMWRLFLMAMALTLLVEAILCLPEKKVQRQGFGDFTVAGSRMKRESA